METRETVKYIVVPLQELMLLGEVEWIEECEILLTEHGLKTHGQSFLVPEHRYNSLIVNPEPKILIP